MNADKMDLSNFQQQIGKTGFPLEHRIGSLLRAAGWTVINNRYYVDDQEQNVREIDLVAYRASWIQHFRVCTTLIISCKKSDENVWALLSRKRDAFDPNLDQQPVHVWTNDKALGYMFSQPKWASDYYSLTQKLGVATVLAEPAVSIFAFQEMNRVSGSPQNDKPIFSSVTGLMKAQSYEIEALPRRRKTPAVYQFNLVNLVDTQLVRLFFSDSDQTAAEVDEEHYIARYIINKRETFARIHFVRANKFEDVLEDYGRLHSANSDIFAKNCDAFYQGVLTDSARTNVYLPEFERELRPRLESRLRVGISLDAKLEGTWFYWSEADKLVEIMLPLHEPAIQFLNEDDYARRYARKALEKFYRYKGAFKFAVEDLPF